MRRAADDLTTTTQVDSSVAGSGAGALAVLVRRLRVLPPNHPSALMDSSGIGRTAGSDCDAPFRRPDSLAQDFWSRTSHFEDLWKAHQERWAQRPGWERSNIDEFTGAWRGDGGRRLTPVENSQADEAIATMQECEPKVTELLRRLEQESPFAAQAVGLEHRLKGSDRLKEKIADGMMAALGVTVADAAGQISDAVRYTFCFEPGSYGPGAADLCARMQAAGCEMLPAKNFWQGDQDYRGINSRWITPEGARFEVQFHTAESHYAKEFLTHDSYDRLRSPLTSRAERNAINTYQALVCDAIPVPPGVSEIDDVRS